MPIPPGSWIAGRYQVIAELGSGSFGEVYRVRDEHQGNEVALKLLDPTRTGPWPWREPTQLTRLRSDYILTVWNADVTAGVPYIVTDVATRGTLTDLLANGPLSPPAAARAIRQAARGTARIHDDHVVHRDLKPDNLFVDADDRVIVGDLGLAYPLDAHGQAPSAGTPLTMAPEVIAGGNASKAADVYSLGVCLYTAVTGEFPYQAHAHDVGELVRAVAAGPPKPVRDLAPTISRGYAAVVETAMARDPAYRYTAAGLDAALGRIAFDLEWVRNDHVGHESCWTSLRSSPVAVCVTRSGRRYDIDVTHQGSVRRIRKHCYTAVLAGALPGRLRRIFENLGN